MAKTTTNSNHLALHDLAKAKAHRLGYLIPDPEGQGPQPDPWRSIFSEATEQFDREMLLTILANQRKEIWDIWGNPFQRYFLNPQPLPPKYWLPQLLAKSLIKVINNSLLQAAVTGTSKAAETYWSKWLSDLPDICPNPRRKIPWPGPWPPIAGLDIDLPDFIITFAATLQLEIHQQMETAIHKNIHAAAEKVLNTLNKG